MTSRSINRLSVPSLSTYGWRNAGARYPCVDELGTIGTGYSRRASSTSMTGTPSRIG